MKPQEVLKKYFGYDQFREGQLEIIESILSKNNTLALMPTGGGKSICFQVPGIIFGGITVVVSPLLSLIKDQVEALERKSIPAIALTSQSDAKQKTSLWNDIKSTSFGFVYVSPEMLETPWWKKQGFAEPSVSLIVVDEAHCISEWGHDFRPSYRKIIDSVTIFNEQVTITAFTATATIKTVEDICQQLQIPKDSVFRSNSIPKHIFISVRNVSSVMERLSLMFEILNKHQHQAGIIYCLTRKMTVEISEQIKQFDFHHRWGNIAFYHGGMKQDARAIVQEAFLRNEIQIIVATNAFGMGVDKPNIRFVIHTDAPSSIEAFVQEIGRAGRDRNQAHSYLLHNRKALKIQNAMATSKNKLIKLRKMVRFAEQRNCLKYRLANYFSITAEKKCHSCSNCVRDKKQLNSVKIDPLLFTKEQFKLVEQLHPNSANEFLTIPGIGRGWLEKQYQSIKSGKIQLYEK